MILCRVSAYRCLKSINKSSLRPVRSEATKPPQRGGLEGVEKRKCAAFSSLRLRKNSPQRCCGLFLRRRRDSNPRNVAVQQFSRLPPSTTRPHLHVPSFLNRAAKIGIISKRAKLSSSDVREVSGPRTLIIVFDVEGPYRRGVRVMVSYRQTLQTELSDSVSDIRDNPHLDSVGQF